MKFETMIENFIGIIVGARAEMIGFGLADERQIDAGVEAFRNWMHRPDAAMWYTTCWAEGLRPQASVAGNRIAVPQETPARRETAVPADDPPANAGTVEDETSLLRFLMDAASDLNSNGRVGSGTCVELGELLS